MTLKEALDAIAKYCEENNCEWCQFRKTSWVNSEKYNWCILQMETPEDWKDIEVME